MSPVIQFKTKDNYSIQNQKIPHKPAEANNFRLIECTPDDFIREEDDSGFIDSEILEKSPTFFEKIKSSILKSFQHTQTKQELLDLANSLYTDALISRNEVAKLIFKAAGNDYSEMLDRHGNLVLFDVDENGNSIMIECDKNSNDRRITTFDRETGEVAAITSFPDVEVFFEDNDRVKITTLTPFNLLKGQTEQVFRYSKSRPVFYERSVYKLNQPVKTEMLAFCDLYV